MHEVRIIELFAGVGGFRIGLERVDNVFYKTVWANQWEPSTKSQAAYDCYVERFGNPGKHSNEDIATVPKNEIPNHTLLVGGFPCQDYSVARSLSNEKGIEGKKGVLWWQIRDTLIAKKAPFCILENVDRLLKSPAKQRGRDFGVMLTCLNELGYSVEWRVINAAQYGAAQRRRRIFIFAYRNDTAYGEKMMNLSAESIIKEIGFMVQAFPIAASDKVFQIRLEEDVVRVSDSFSFSFENAGYMSNGVIYTATVTEQEEKPTTLGEILMSNVEEKFYITDEKMPKWRYLKGAKK
jgi:DNA (cytosine-5)-methyltransferase 1